MESILNVETEGRMEGRWLVKLFWGKLPAAHKRKRKYGGGERETAKMIRPKPRLRCSAVPTSAER